MKAGVQGMPHWRENGQGDARKVKMSRGKASIKKSRRGVTRKENAKGSISLVGWYASRMRATHEN